ncbi:MAG: ATP-grasp domain-containing protein [Sulfuritalea sp.]|nr:ATP-grasp domain-containing protein [Sulfuritalea sp.]
MAKRRVLVFPAGTEIGLEIFHALKHCKEVVLLGAGQDISNHARFAYPEYHILPSIHELGWVDALSELCQSLCIDYIFPAYDDVIIALSREADRIPAKVISSSPSTCEITRSKSDTYRALSGAIRVPRMFASMKTVDRYPVLVKPDRGQGSFGITQADNEDELVRAIQAIRDPIICEYLPGEEYTVDCFSDRERGLLFAGARRRRRIRNGISVNTLSETLPEIKEMASLIGSQLGLRGAWFFQLKRAQDGQLTLLEVAPRIAGSMAVHRVSGVNFPLLSIFEEERLPITIRPIDGSIELDRALGNRYRHSINFSTLYIDLDDTLLINGQVNLLAMKLLFQCINNGKKIVLLSRHRGDLDQMLARHRLSGLFDEIIHLGEEEKKSSSIKQSDAIFVDDSFAERMDVSEHCNIPTFDCSMIELLTEQAEALNGGGE